MDKHAGRYFAYRKRRHGFRRAQQLSTGCNEENRNGNAVQDATMHARAHRAVTAQIRRASIFCKHDQAALHKHCGVRTPINTTFFVAAKKSRAYSYDRFPASRASVEREC
jgi:hypothetical protein